MVSSSVARRQPRGSRIVVSVALMLSLGVTAPSRPGHGAKKDPVPTEDIPAEVLAGARHEVFKSAIIDALREAGAEHTASALEAGALELGLHSGIGLRATRFKNTSLGLFNELTNPLANAADFADMPGAVAAGRLTGMVTGQSQRKTDAKHQLVGHLAPGRFDVPELPMLREDAMNDDGVPTIQGIAEAIRAAYVHVELEGDIGALAHGVTRAEGEGRRLEEPTGLRGWVASRFKAAPHEKEAIARQYAIAYMHRRLNELDNEADGSAGNGDAERQRIEATIERLLTDRLVNKTTRALVWGLHQQLIEVFQDPGHAEKRTAEFEARTKAERAKLPPSADLQSAKRARSHRELVARSRATMTTRPAGIPQVTETDLGWAEYAGRRRSRRRSKH